MGMAKEALYSAGTDDRLIGHIAGTLRRLERQYLYSLPGEQSLEGDGRMTHIMSAYQLCKLVDRTLQVARPVFRDGTIIRPDAGLFSSLGQCRHEPGFQVWLYCIGTTFRAVAGILYSAEGHLG